VIDLPSFYMDFEGRQNREKGYKSSSADMNAEVAKLKKENVDAIIVDLRSNGGGSLDESIDIAGLFFDKGPVVQIKDTRGSTYVQKDEDGKTLYSGPLVVMINRHSASASEIFAGAIQDYQRGLIVGDTHTFGKGTVQNLNDIDEKLGAIKVTISKFYRPSGSSTQLKGVESDVVIPDLLTYDYALPWEKIASSEYKPFGQVAPENVKMLREASKARVAADKNFEKLAAAVKEFKDGEDSRSKVSLKEETADAKKVKDQKTAKDDKAAKEDKKKKDLEEEDDDGEKLPLAEDFHLQETLKITADYVQLLNKKALVKVAIPDVDKVSVAEQANPAKKDELKSHP
jgi:carboxyl-terminal processing protease